MAMTAGIAPVRRGPPRSGEFGYAVKAGEKVFRGGVICINAAGNVVRPQTGGAVAMLGIADRDLDNSASATVSATSVVALKGIFQLTVTGANFANINAPVYASDDNTFTLAAGSLLQVGTLAGIEGGLTYVMTLGA